MRAIIFDFDGTIADSFAFVSQLMAEQGGRPGLSLQERQREFSGLSMRDIMKKLHKSPWWGLWMFLHGRRVMTKHMDEVRPFAGMVETLRVLHERGYQLFIVSSNRNENVRLFLDHYQLATYFYHTQGNASLLGKSFALRQLLLRDHLDTGDCFYVGDEVGDLEAARRLNVRSVAVTWGYSRAAALAAEKPFAVVETPEELLRVLTAEDASSTRLGRS